LGIAKIEKYFDKQPFVDKNLRLIDVFVVLG
jgi:hypothetical protein